MPSIQTVLPPVIGPSGPQNVRANPHMFDAEAQAKEGIGQAVQGVADLGFRIKNATDNAYLIQANTKLQAAHQDFKTWTQTQPDTTQWGEEFEARTKAAREEVDAGASNLSQMAKLRLRTEADSWQARAAADTRSMASSQNIHNALGIAQEGVTAAIGANDSETAHAIIDTSVKDGVMHANVGAALKKRVDIGIATNVANSDASNDPFTFIEKLNETDADGSPKNYKGLPPASRATMQFRATKLANETRTQTMRDWTQAIYDAQQQGAPMPDKDTILTEAKRQGISPKWVEKAFAPPKPELNQEEFAHDITRLNGLHLTDDPSAAQLAEATAIVTKYQKETTAHSVLMKMLDDKKNSAHPTNSPASRELFRRAEEEHSAGLFLPRATVTEKVGGYGPWHWGGEKQTKIGTAPDVGDPDHWKNTAAPEVLDAEAKAYAGYLTKMRAYFDVNPKATDEEATAYSQQIKKPYVMAKVVDAITATKSAPAGSKFTKGQRAKQGGQIFEYDGSTWNPVK